MLAASASGRFSDAAGHVMHFVSFQGPTQWPILERRRL